MTDFGTDLATFNGDLDPYFGTVSGQAALLQWCVNALIVPVGSLFYAPDQGFGLSRFVGENLDASILRAEEQAASAALQNDERVDQAVVRVEIVPDTQRVKLTAWVQPVNAPAFTFVLSFPDLTVELLAS